MGQSDSKDPKTICSMCNKPTDVSFTLSVEYQGTATLHPNVCPYCFSSYTGEVKKQLANYSPEA